MIQNNSHMPAQATNTPESLEKLAGSSYTKVFEMLHTGIAILSRDGIFLYANNAFMDMFGLGPETIGGHVSEYFLTSEQGVMTTIRTHKLTVCSSVTKNNVQGVSFRYPVLGADNELIGVIIESISTSIGKDKLLSLLETVRNIEEQADYLERRAQKKPGMLFTFASIVGESPAMQTMKERGRKFAKSDEHILIFGESGTGKELVAQALHSASPRAEKPFVTLNCAALPHELIDSELFGYEAGAFTGARSGGMKGKFEEADKGTIFLDEIGELPLSMQAKLLRVLESGEIQKIGHSGRLHSDFRLVAATNKDLSKLVAEGSFREDLYHRLNTLELVVPPLRERISDIPLLSKYFIEQSVGHKRAREIQISHELYRCFSRYTWRGNIRELKNVLTFALYSLEGDGNILGIKHLPERFLRDLNASLPGTGPNTGPTNAPEAGSVAQANTKAVPGSNLGPASGPDATPVERNLAKAGAEAERKTLLAVLASTEYNKTLAARILGISRNKLYKKMRDLGLHSKTEHV